MLLCLEQFLDYSEMHVVTEAFPALIGNMVHSLFTKNLLWKEDQIEACFLVIQYNILRTISLHENNMLKP